MNKLATTPLWMYSLGFLLLFLMWGGLVYFPKPDVDAEAYISYIQNTLLLLTGHILTILNSTTPPPDIPPGTQQTTITTKGTTT